MDIGIGDKVKDTISGLEGIVVARTEWLNGCIRISVQPQETKDGKPVDGHTFDQEQLALIAKRHWQKENMKEAPKEAPPMAAAATAGRPPGGPRIEPTRNADPIER